MERFGLMNAMPIRRKQKANPVFNDKNRRHPHIIPIRRNLHHLQAKQSNEMNIQERRYNLFGIGKTPANNHNTPDKPHKDLIETSLDISNFSPKISSTQINDFGNMPLSSAHVDYSKNKMTDTSDEGFFNNSSDFMSGNKTRISNRMDTTRIASNPTDTINNEFPFSSNQKYYENYCDILNKPFRTAEAHNNMKDKNDIHRRYQSRTLRKHNNSNYHSDFNAENSRNTTFNYNFDYEIESAPNPKDDFDKRTFNNSNNSWMNNDSHGSFEYNSLDKTKTDFHVNNLSRHDTKCSHTHRSGYSNTEISNWLDGKDSRIAKPKYSKNLHYNISTLDRPKYSEDLNFNTSTLDKSEYHLDFDFDNNDIFEWDHPKFTENNKTIRHPKKEANNYIFTDDNILDNHKSSNTEFRGLDETITEKESNAFNTTNEHDFCYGTDVDKELNGFKTTNNELIKYTDHHPEQSRTTNIYNTKNAPRHINIFL